MHKTFVTVILNRRMCCFHPTVAFHRLNYAILDSRVLSARNRFVVVWSEHRPI
ncbi:hypothetical protein BLA29_010092 [Euroglyphus maynei]|uniref:Uncharacterized protein n=1 Tax=Euroglyphus maynei TaxID=6958 RepID=A0A1Y3BBZ3_EURMA|nr:hypothetical protein BLA29_010092 [Euroglyphus maynei]